MSLQGESMPWFEERENSLILNIRVIPRASKDSIQGLMGNSLKVRIQAPPVGGKANARLIRFLAKQWKMPRAGIELLSGGTARNKRIRIIHPPAELRKELLSFGEG
jgi:uncharacterized protein (TIGR00251 family)